METQPPPLPVTQDWAGKSVMILDDSAFMRELIEATYRSLGFQISGNFANPFDLLSNLKSTPVDLVSLDIIVPEMHGIECWAKIKETKPQQKCIFISCLDTSPIFKQAMAEQLPPQLLIGKPLSAQLLNQALVEIFRT